MNHKKYLQDLFNSIYVYHTPNYNFEVIYIDNCSSDDSVDFVKEKYPNVKIVENKEIRGFGANNNTGTSIAKGEYIAIINPDIVLLENSLDNLIAFADKNEGCGIFVPQLLNPDLSIQYSIRSFISIKIIFYRLISRGKDTSNIKVINKYLQKNIDFTKTQYVDWAIGASMLIKRDFYNMLGGFDERYFLYMEDEDICLSSWLKNRPVVYLPTSQMIHNHLRASSKINKKTLMHIKSMCKFFLKNGLDSRRNK